MKNSIKSICRPLCGALLALAANSAAAQASGKYSFAVVPHYNATELHKGWAPVLQRISRETGLELEIKIAPSIPEFETEFLKGVPDFVYLNPYQAVLAKQAHGYVPLLRESKSLSGILVVRNDSPYRSVRDLKGQTVAFPTLNGFGAVTYLRALLASEEGIRFEARYVKSHANVFRHVIRNEAAAGGSVTRALNHELPDLREQLRIIYKTPEFAAHPIMVHPRVPESARKAMVQAVLAMTKDDAGRALLKGIGTPEPVVANYERDYLPLEKLNIQRSGLAERD